MKKNVWVIIYILMISSCHMKNERNESEIGEINLKSQTVELISYKTSYSDIRATIFYPNISMKWKNVSNRSITEDIRVEVVFIDNVKNEELGRDYNWMQRESEAPFLQDLSKNTLLQSPNGYSHYGKDLEGMFNSIDCSCYIYLNGELYTEIKMENPYKQLQNLLKEKNKNRDQMKPGLEESITIKEAKKKAEEKRQQDRETQTKAMAPIDRQIEKNKIEKMNMTGNGLRESDRESKNIEKNLSERKLMNKLEKPKYKVDDYGTVVVDITIDPKGNVVEAEIGKGTTTPNKELRNASIEAAKKLIYNEIDSDENQKGSITYKFNLN